MQDDLSEVDKIRMLINSVKIEVPQEFLNATRIFCEEQKVFNINLWDATNVLKEVWMQHAKEYQATLIDIEKRLRALEQSNHVTNPSIESQLN